VRDANVWEEADLPIHRERALSLAKNPRAEEDDAALIVGYEGGETAGFLGMLPDRVFFGGEAEKIGWFSGWWVAPERRRSGLGAALFLKGMSAYEKKVGISWFSEDAKRFYDRSGMFFALKEMEGVRLTIRHGPPRPRTKRLGSPLEFFSKIRLARWRRRQGAGSGGGGETEYVSEVDEEIRALLREHRRKELTFREAPELDWILKTPWSVSAPPGDPRRGRYYFDPYVENFSCRGVKVRGKEGGLVGFMILAARNGGLRMPYGVFRPGHSAEIWRALGAEMIELGLKSFVTYHPDLAGSVSKENFPYVRRKKATRLCYLSKAFEGKDTGDLHLQDGEGDAAF
ncbi:MAG: GNAT family N-acetyltransferase, partial [bacterium]